MTAQIGDVYKYQNKDYKLVALSNGIAFNPESFGLEPHAKSSACWRGYWCEFVVENDELMLKNLYLFNKNNEYPQLNGVEVASPEFIKFEKHRGARKKSDKFSLTAHFGHRAYYDVNIPIAYTGRILVGNGFLNEYGINLGLQQSFAYSELIEFVFEEGVLLECNDLSFVAESQRDEIIAHKKNSPHPDELEILKFIAEDCFSKYKDKMWWLEKKSPKRYH